MSSVRACTGKAMKIGFFLNLDFHSFCSFGLQNSDFCHRNKSASCAATELSKDSFFCQARRYARPCGVSNLWELCGHFRPKTGPKGGSPPGRGPGGGSEGGKWHQNGTDGAHKSAFQTSAEAGKVMKYSIFSAPAARICRGAYADARRRRGNIGAYLITFPASAVVWMALMNGCGWKKHDVGGLVFAEESHGTPAAPPHSYPRQVGYLVFEPR